MAETPRTVPLRVQVDQEAMRKLGSELTAALDAFTAQLRATAKRNEEAREVAALFRLYREARDLDAFTGTGLSNDERAARQVEVRAMLNAAIEGYDMAYLASLATFGGWLSDAAGKEWRSRT